MNKRDVVEFRPLQGLLGVGERIASMFGLENSWAGPDGIGAVMREKLLEMGVPEKPIPLHNGQPFTPRQIAEHAGVIKRRKARRAR